MDYSFLLLLFAVLKVLLPALQISELGNYVLLHVHIRSRYFGDPSVKLIVTYYSKVTIINFIDTHESIRLSVSAFATLDATLQQNR